MTFTPDDLQVNKIFQGRNKSLRQIIWVGALSVQYDSDTLRSGRNYPEVAKDAFLRWAVRDVTGVVDDNWNIVEKPKGL